MQLCKLLSEMPIDLHKLVANYLRKIHTSQYLKAISCLMGVGWGERGGGAGKERGNSSVKTVQTCAIFVPWNRTWLSRCSSPSKGYPLWHCDPLVR